MVKFLGKSKVSKNYQTTLNTKVRAMLGCEPGDTLQWTYVNGKVIVKKAGEHSTAIEKAVRWEK